MNRKDQEVRELLRAQDPARDDDGIPAPERAQMRRTVLDAVRDHSARPALVPALAGAGLGLTLLALVMAVLVVWRPEPVPSQPESGTAGVAGPPAGAVPARQIQMTTPGGTRIVWILKS